LIAVPAGGLTSMYAISKFCCCDVKLYILTGYG